MVAPVLSSLISATSLAFWCPPLLTMREVLRATPEPALAAASVCEAPVGDAPGVRCEPRERCGDWAEALPTSGSLAAGVLVARAPVGCAATDDDELGPTRLGACDVACEPVAELDPP